MSQRCQFWFLEILPIIFNSSENFDKKTTQHEKLTSEADLRGFFDISPRTNISELIFHKTRYEDDSTTQNQNLLFLLKQVPLNIDVRIDNINIKNWKSSISFCALQLVSLTYNSLIDSIHHRNWILIQIINVFISCN